MYKNGKLLIGKNEDYEAYLLPKMANRHGLITGASGSGKTITLKVMAESFSSAGVPVFLVDVKGDLSATSLAGEVNENISKRVDKLKLEDFETKFFPVTYLDVYGNNGHPVRTTVASVGSRLLAKMLNLSEAQEGVLTVAFKVAEDEGLELIDLNDLKSMLIYISGKKEEYSIKYGNITTQSVAAIQRNILVLESDGGDYFFGTPAFNIKDLIHYNENDGRGQINILDAVTLFKKPDLYATFLIWLLNEIYNTMPEVGDLPKPKLVMFIDEAHLLFNEMPNHLVKQIIQIVKLIRSKGVGLYFISQAPSDIPDEILSQLGNRVQHVLRSYTKSDEKNIKAAADSFRSNPKFKTVDVISSLSTGEALVSFQNENSEPEVVEKVTILPPQSRMGEIDSSIREKMITKSYLYNKYEQRVETDGASKKLAKEEPEKEVKSTETTNSANQYSIPDPFRKKENSQTIVESKSKPAAKGRPKKSAAEKMATKVENKILNKAASKIVNKLFK